MPEYGSTVLLVFILFSCVYKKHVRDWWWFRFGIISLLVHLATQELASFARSGGFVLGAVTFAPSLVFLLSSLSILAALGGLLMACLKHAQEDSEHLRCLKCGYILKGLSEPRCPECGKKI